MRNLVLALLCAAAISCSSIASRGLPPTQLPAVNFAALASAYYCTHGEWPGSLVALEALHLNRDGDTISVSGLDPRFVEQLRNASFFPGEGDALTIQGAYPTYDLEVRPPGACEPLEGVHLTLKPAA